MKKIAIIVLTIGVGIGTMVSIGKEIEKREQKKQEKYVQLILSESESDNRKEKAKRYTGYRKLDCYNIDCADYSLANPRKGRAGADTIEVPFELKEKPYFKEHFEIVLEHEDGSLTIQRK